MYRLVKILLVLSVAAWGFIGAVDNVAGWAGTTGAVTAATSMGAIEGSPNMWRATTNPLIVTIGAALIPMAKIAVGLLCTFGALAMWKTRDGDQEAFQGAKTKALAGCALGVFFLFAGWIVIAETWFELWRSDVWRDAALQSAFRYAGFIALIGLIVGRADE